MAPRAARPDFPLHQLIVLSICRLVEPIAFTSIFPYVYYMVARFEITDNDSQIAMWTGGAVTAFAFAEFLTGMWWGRLSDRIGRKPVLIVGLMGTGISMLGFGLAPSMPLALAARAIGGLLNGNVGVIQTTVAELVPKKEYQPRAYSIMPFVWSFGSIIGPTIGGLLAEPATYYPDTFSKEGIFGQFPYLLPNLACSMICVIGVLTGILFLDETHPMLINKHDSGREMGHWIQDKFRSIFYKQYTPLPTDETETYSSDSTPVLSRSTSYNSQADEHTPLLNSETSSITLSASSRNSSISSLKKLIENNPAQKAFINAWSPQVIHNIIAYGIIAFHTITYDQIMSVFLQTPKESAHLDSFLKFTGGFSVTTQTMGVIFSYQGFLATFIQFAVFAPFVRYVGVLRTFRFVSLTFPILYFITPYIAFLKDENDNFVFGVVYAILSVKVLYVCLIYPCNSILLTNSSPSLLVLGVINGVAASVASCCRAIAPTLMGWLYSRGVDMGVMGLSWWICGFIAIAGAVQSLYITDADGEVVHDEATKALEGREYCVGDFAVRDMEAGEVLVVQQFKDGVSVIEVAI